MDDEITVETEAEESSDSSASTGDAEALDVDESVDSSTSSAASGDEVTSSDFVLSDEDVERIAVAVDSRTLSTVNAALGSDARALAKLTLNESVAYMPDGGADYVAGYMTPFLWGLLVGLFGFLLGLTWEAFTRFLRLARPR